MVEGEALGTWTIEQRAGWGQLVPTRRSLPETVDVNPAVAGEPQCQACVLTPGSTDRALRRYHEFLPPSPSSWPATGLPAFEVGMTTSPCRVHGLTAHPDDEVFAHGAAIAMLSQRGSRVVMRTASGGRPLRMAPRPPLSASTPFRATGCACTRLGVSEWNWLAEGRWTDTAGRQTLGSLTARQSQTWPRLLPLRSTTSCLTSCSQRDLAA
ncbi:PIG-L family deacetylase [Streptomyces sp. NPDC094149]|uniref:PIG-L family deacetylase n=1 Tax=Streptomyces sp. NPDC094149 TaxID=3155079 RepID=UPI003330626C